MNSRHLRDHYRHVVIVLILSLACRDGSVVGTAAAGQLSRAATSATSSADALPLPAVSSQTVVGGGGLHIATYASGNPSGPSIVFIHGFTGSLLSWERQLAGSLTSDFRLVAYDLRGHGASDKPLDPAKYTDGTLWADDLDALIRGMHVDRPVLVGWSYGGYVIADYLRKYGDGALGGIVFVGAVTKQGTAEAASYLSDDLLALFPDVLSADVQKSIEGTRSLTRMFAHPLQGTLWEHAFGGAMMVPPVVRVAMFSRVLDNDDVLAHVHVPTLVVQGAADQLVRTSAAAHIAATVPGAKLVVYDGVGHGVQFDAPERFNRDLAAFVQAAQRHQHP
jgi:pimeloyl-ACP methyl ester carboxylesterase